MMEQHSACDSAEIEQDDQFIVVFDDAGRPFVLKMLAQQPRQRMHLRLFEKLLDAFDQQGDRAAPERHQECLRRRLVRDSGVFEEWAECDASKWALGVAGANRCGFSALDAGQVSAANGIAARGGTNDDDHSL
jgi:hypothetical protein